MSRSRKPPVDAEPAEPVSTELAKRDQSLEQRLGELDLSNVDECGVLLDDIIEFQKVLASAKSRIEGAIIERATIDGVSAYDLPGRLKAEIRSGRRTTIAGDVLEQGLRDAGMPEERIAEIVETVVTYKAKAVEAKKAGRMNPAYQAALDAASTVHESAPSVSIRRR